jgi:hypothetical protein
MYWTLDWSRGGGRLAGSGLSREENSFFGAGRGGSGGSGGSGGGVLGGWEARHYASEAERRRARDGVLTRRPRAAIRVQVPVHSFYY